MKEGACERENVFVCASCMPASEPLLPCCSGLCLPLVELLSTSPYSPEPLNFRGSAHKIKRGKGDPTSAPAEILEIENYDVCDILRFVCPVFTWFCLFLKSCMSATEQ